MAERASTSDSQRNRFSGLPRAAQIYIVLVVAAAVAATIAFSLSIDQPGVDPVLLIVIAAFCAGGNLFEIFMPGHWSFQPNMLFFFAGALLLPPWAVAVLAIACFLPGYIANRQVRPERFPVYKVWFNIGNYLLAGLAAHELANVGSTVPSMADSEVGAVVMLGVAAITFALINHGLIILAVWRAGEQPLRAAARGLGEGLPLDMALCLTGACLAVLWDTAPAVVILSPGPALLVLRALRSPLLVRDAEELRDEVGVLQAALLPDVPSRLGGVELSVAYRPAEGPGAGGDFYDVIELERKRVAIVLGDVSGHGRDALGRSALMRYTLRAYLDAGLGPREALRVAGNALHTEVGDDFATVIIGIHDPASGTLTYASAGHPPPIVLGNGTPTGPVTDCSAPPVGVGVPTGVRQTTIPAPSGSIVCFYTDGVIEARVEGATVGVEGVTRRLAALGREASAEGLVGPLAEEVDMARDDMAVCLLRVLDGPATGAVRVEEMHCTPEELAGDMPARFLRATGYEPGDATSALQVLRTSQVDSGWGALLRVHDVGRRPRLEVIVDPAEGAGPFRRRKRERSEENSETPEPGQATLRGKR